MKNFAILAFITLIITSLNYNTKKQESIPILTFYGGAQEVGGSCMLMQYRNTSVLIDCGIYYLEEVHDETEHSCKGSERLYQQNTSFAFNPSTLNAVLITHALIDHCERLKYLYDKGLRAPVYVSTLTRDLSLVMIKNIIRYDESQRNWIYS